MQKPKRMSEIEHRKLNIVHCFSKTLVSAFPYREISTLILASFEQEHRARIIHFCDSVTGSHGGKAMENCWSGQRIFTDPQLQVHYRQAVHLLKLQPLISTASG